MIFFRKKKQLFEIDDDLDWYHFYSLCTINYQPSLSYTDPVHIFITS